MNLNKECRFSHLDLNFSYVVILTLALFASKNLDKGKKTQYLSEALPSAIEGITIVYIVISVLLLGMIGIASAEGCLSILSAISGYVLGKNQGKRLSENTLDNHIDGIDGK